jgi:hypothetical protein
VLSGTVSYNILNIIEASLKMPVQNLLDINPDKLFEDHTISEILETQKKLQAEIERKREELRTMVG